MIFLPSATTTSSTPPLTAATTTTTAKQILNRLGNGFGLTYTMLIFFFNFCIYTITNPTLSPSLTPPG
jgi:hypothetical protein